MALSEWNDSSRCFWRHIYLWITSLCKYFACSKLHPQTLDYRCCCVTLAASFLCFFSALLCSNFFSFLFICLASNLMSASLLSPSLRLLLSLSLATQSFFLSVCLLHFFFASPSLMMLSLAFEAASFVPDSHSSDWDILGFKVTQTDLLS